MEMMMFIPLMIGMMYFLVIRPQQKQKRQAAELRNSLQVGDEIMTIGGHMGKVVRVQEDFVVFENGEDRVRHKIAKWGVASKTKATD